MTPKRVVLLLVGLTVVVLGGLLFACAATPTSVPIRSFERAQKVDVVCLRLSGPDAPQPVKQEECAPVPSNVSSADLQNQLFALVTQTSRGEVAVVNLSAGSIVDERHAMPGLNFLPVGANPTDIASTPDGRMAFVASAEPNKFAIYGIPGHRILGDQSPVGLQQPPVALTSWPVCALPQRPGALSVVPRRNADGSTPTGPGALPYELVAVLPGDRLQSPKVVTIDPRPFLRATPRKALDGRVLDDDGAGPALTPGSLEPCPVSSAIEVVGSEAVPASFRPGPRWDDGVPWVDGGVDLGCEVPEQPSRCGLKSCSCKDPTTGSDRQAGDAGAPDASAPSSACELDAGTSDDATERPLPLGPLEASKPLAVARDDQTLYVADAALPLIHVIDLSVAGAPRELPPFVVTSIVDPSRVVSIRDLAVSPPTSAYKRFLYAVDRDQGSIAVFDITDPKTAERTPMRRPHPELNPFSPPDRITFGAPVVSVSFARNDWPLARIDGVARPSARTGQRCNPNPAVVPPQGGAALDDGYYYRPGFTNVDVDLGPRRLRGVFAFATLSNGEIDAIDIDDWDAPCRRPTSLGRSDNAAVPVLASVAPPTSVNDRDPFHVRVASTEAVSNELFFPVSAPHRPRSAFMLRDDPSTGRHIPFLQTTPTLSSTRDVTPPLVGPGSEIAPKIHPTRLTVKAPSKENNVGTNDVGVLLSFDDPSVHFDQDWTITYEGKLPNLEGLPATVTTSDAYGSLVLSQPQARYCSKGVEDWATAGERANATALALASIGGSYPERMDRRMVDYVQIADNLLSRDDAFWRQGDLPEPDSCWDPRLSPANAGDVEGAAGRRYDFCASYFGSADDPTENRDAPILEAYDDRLVVGRFYTFPSAKPGETATREVVYKDASNAAHLKLVRCCFHHQVNYAVRTGSTWLTTGSKVGYLHHITRASDGRCVQSCEARQSLLNSRAPALPGTAPLADFPPFRDSPLAMRNPAMSFFIQNGYDENRRDKPPVRDMALRFSTRGEFVPLSINLASQTISVNPQSMKFIDSLGQIAVVDAASQGLVLIDLAGVSIARAPYY